MGQHKNKSRIKLVLKAPNHYLTMLNPRIKLYNLMWTFNQYDDDPFPSVPHGHCHEKDLKISLFDGSVYRGKSRTLIGSASKKELRNLQKNQKFVDFTVTAVEYYKGKFPNVPIKVPAWVSTDESMKAISVKQEQQPDTMKIAIAVKLIDV